MRPFYLSSVLLWLLAFLPVVKSFVSLRYPRLFIEPSQSSAGSVKATVISPESLEPYSTEDDEAISSSFSHYESYTSVIYFLESEALDRLARLAVAFSPPDKEFKLEAIEEISVISINENSIDIEVMLCENDGCVGLLVPVKFPRSCQDSGDYMECVVDNIALLDVHANEIMLNSNWEARLYQEGIDVEGQKKILRDPRGVKYPEWWIPSNVAEDCLHECHSITELLNDDEFAKDVQNLALTCIKIRKPHYIHVVELAAVTAVGPAGLIMRASVRDIDTYKLYPMEVSMAFRKPATDVTSLRAAILATIDSL